MLSGRSKLELTITIKHLPTSTKKDGIGASNQTIHLVTLKLNINAKPIT